MLQEEISLLEFHPADTKGTPSLLLLTIAETDPNRHCSCSENLPGEHCPRKLGVCCALLSALQLLPLFGTTACSPAWEPQDALPSPHTHPGPYIHLAEGWYVHLALTAVVALWGAGEAESMSRSCHEYRF